MLASSMRSKSHAHHINANNSAVGWKASVWIPPVRSAERGYGRRGSNASSWNRNSRHKPGAVSQAGDDVKLSPNEVDSLAHTDQAKSCRKSCRFYVEAYPVVEDIQAKLSF